MELSLDLDPIIKDFEQTRICGEIEVTLPPPPRKHTIANWKAKTFAEQRFQYTIQPPRNEEPSDDFLEQETRRIHNGYWFFNNGNLEWITGYHYVMLNYSLIDGIRPIFNDSQQMFFWVWDAVEKDKSCLGLCLTTSRRWGKGEVAIIIGYMRTILREYSHFGFQSKTGDDAKLLFQKLIQRWKRFPIFLKPTDSGETNPRQELRFSEPGKRSSKGELKEYKPALESWIDFKPSVNNAYDGDKLQTYVNDEAAKAEKADPYETWEVVKFCLLNGSTVIGKALYTTTVESGDVYESSVSYKKLWDDSNPKERLPNGRTKSGMWRYYNPGYMGYYGEDETTGESFIDDYGYSRRELAKAHIMKGREGLEGNQLASQIRKLSLTVKEAFLSDGETCYFNAMNIENQRTWLTEYAPKGLIRRVTFYRGEKDRVTFRDDPQGKFQLIWSFQGEGQTNKFKISGGYREPDNQDFGAVGVDPYSFTETVSGKQSNGVAYLYRKGDPTDPEFSGMPIIRYADRPPRKSIFYDNVLLMAEWAGVKINYEADINDFIEYYEQIGKHKYLMYRPKSSIDPMKKRAIAKRQVGTLSKDSFALQRHFDLVNLYVETTCDKIMFIELLDSLLKYDHYKRTKFDDVVAFGMSLLGSTEHVKTMPKEIQLKILHNFTKKPAKKSPFPTYKKYG